MANVQAAIDAVMRQEDSTLSGRVTEDAGGRTRYGIAEKFHPDLTASLFYTSMGSIAAQEIAEAIYLIQYAEPLCLEEIPDQGVANLLLSIGVNCGVMTAARMLQEVLKVNGDGRIGILTLYALDSATPADVLGGLRGRAAEHYEALIEEHPGWAKYRNGWMARIGA
jgi:lysozyme family protein